MNRHVLGAKQFDRAQLESIMAAAQGMEQVARSGGSHLLTGKVMASLFFEPSTRTRFSFETAMTRLGGHVISTENASQFSSAIKGETLEDSIRVISSYADVIVMRHYEIGAAARAARISSVPILNAGDGAGEHPTQALLDLYTIQKELGSIDGISIAMVGDLTYGRTVHSLAYVLANFRDVTIWFTAPENTPIPQAVKDYLAEKGVRYHEDTDLRRVAGLVDVLYQTRVQRERFPSEEEYKKAAGKYIVDRELLDSMKQRSILMHPLPRAGEIATECDNDPRAAYFRQAENGVYVRMALLANAVGKGMTLVNNREMKDQLIG
ncbi:aspartate carbamoyltransferase [Effusibacillus lacus]|uniref:Aspartate carbamoyltransferase n=1 Tax=Effusibacillus lacus TaxID=1348429 RepID=A0A292YIQ4_9BACL|nr:aspartate carbamoyltransferase [Effusibacillus lacus]TCS75645.1 aspartate carbamoyltransferase [Effusibacillus lacus]GAX90967.1 aspartate carbamoyltransferase [Effusibacillus lacus]